MNILFVSPYTPTPIRTRSYNQVRTLQARGNRVTLLTVWENPQEEQALGELRERGVTVLARPLNRMQIARNAARAIASSLPVQAWYSWQPQLAQDLRAQLSAPARHDVVHVEHLRGSKYALLAQGATAPNGTHIPVVWDSVDCISYLFEQASRDGTTAKGRTIAALEIPRTRQLEAKLVRSFDRVLVTSEIDRQALLDLAARFGTDRSTLEPEHVCVLPVGVDLDYFVPRNTERAPATLVFSGKLSYHANVAAAAFLVKAVMPLVWEQAPETRVTLVGKDPTSQVRELVRVNPERIHVTGTVPDIRPYLAEATMSVVPMVYAAGIQNKMLEAMALATPVVASRGAVATLHPDAAHAALTGDDARSIAAAIVRLLKDYQLRAELGGRGRVFVEQYYRWDRITALLEALYTKAAAHGFERDS